jgi:hypothetical protein
MMLSMPNRVPAAHLPCASRLRVSWLPGVLAGALAAAALPAPAAAQERIHAEVMPELALDEPVMLLPGSKRATGSSDREAGRKARALWDVGAALGQILQDAQRAEDRSGAFSEGYVRLRWGKRWSPERVVQLGSALQLYGRELDTIADSDPEAQGFLDGRHHARAAFDVVPGGRDSKAPLLDLGFDLEGRFDHVTENARALAPVELGPGAHRDASVRAEVAPRFLEKDGSDERAGFAVPITLAGRRVDHAGADAGVDSATTRRLGIGVAAHMIDTEILRLDVGLMGMERAQTEYALAPAPGAPMPPGSIGERLVDESTLYFGKLDLAVFDDDLAVIARGQTGWTWLRDPRTGRNTNLFTIDYGFQVIGQRQRVGLGFGRVAEIAADGGRFLTDHRLELEMAWTGASTVGSVRGVASWMTDRDRRGSMDPGLLERYAVHGEIHRALESGLGVGLYAVSAYEPDRVAWAAGGDPWATPVGWDLELGGFARWSGAL